MPSSFRKAVENSRMQFRRENVPMGLPELSEFSLWQCDENAVRAAREAFDACRGAVRRRDENRKVLTTMLWSRWMKTVRRRYAMGRGLGFGRRAGDEDRRTRWKGPRHSISFSTGSSS